MTRSGKLFGALGAAALLMAVAPSTQAQSVGFANFSASISTTGSTTRSNGVQSSAQVSTGVYSVVFSQNISTCIFTASINGAQAGLITVSLKSGTTNTLAVRTFSPSGALASRRFSIIVTCGP